jgi:hypothetical protein
MISPVVVYREGKALLDRQSMAHVAGRSVHTIRARCPIAEHHLGRAMYDMEDCLAILEAIPTRRPRAQVDQVA